MLFVCPGQSSLKIDGNCIIMHHLFYTIHLSFLPRTNGYFYIHRQHFCALSTIARYRPTFLSAILHELLHHSWIDRYSLEPVDLVPPDRFDHGVQSHQRLASGAGHIIVHSVCANIGALPLPSLSYSDGMGTRHDPREIRRKNNSLTCFPRQRVSHHQLTYSGLSLRSS